MSISIVYHSKSATENNFEKGNKHLIQPILEYLVEFVTNNPTAQVYDEFTSGKDFNEVIMEIRCVDQTQLDLYLSDPRNIQAKVEGFKADSAIAAFCVTNQCTIETSVVNDSTTVRGRLLATDLANTLANEF